MYGKGFSGAGKLEPDYANLRMLILVGRSMGSSMGALHTLNIARANGAKVVSVDPRMPDIAYGDAKWVPISAEIEQEVSELDAEEAKAFLADLGEEEPGLNRLIRSAYSMLGLINFFTVGPDECRSWTVRAGTKAPKAAGKIHSDIERGFIRAEIVSYKDLMECGSYTTVREKGLLRVEGKDYIIQDGDIAYFRFNV